MQTARETASTRYHPFNARLKDEAACEDLPLLVFAPNRIEDVSKVKAEQKNGNDFLLHLLNSDGTYAPPVRCENKFETYASGRLTLEWVSVDRPNLTPGWMVTSRTAWLLSWFAKTGDVIALPMDELRALVLKSPGRNKATTALNPRYLTWNTLEDINFLLANLPNARALDLRYEMGATPAEASMVRGAGALKRCTSEQLCELMRQLPAQSTPLTLSEGQLIGIMSSLARVNMKKNEPQHAARIQALPFKL